MKNSSIPWKGIGSFIAGFVGVSSLVVAAMSLFFTYNVEKDRLTIDMINHLISVLESTKNDIFYEYPDVPKGKKRIIPGALEDSLKEYSELCNNTKHIEATSNAAQGGAKQLSSGCSKATTRKNARLAVVRRLNYFEGISIAYKKCIINRKMMDESIGDIFVDFFGSSFEYIKHKVEEKGPTAWGPFIELSCDFNNKMEEPDSDITAMCNDDKLNEKLSIKPIGKCFL
uniref:Uncharacterized protein n=1 Tax=Candidatus Kentrum sp. LPFa TaxID=2126335 RepID=A0A450WFL7_9GAMM|nr:MAG: hypothetical protein BECKLPF1236A_GA0070988_1013410 [Candidatus Kentron sp. LPFa]VFK31387.1 MAG: hypothetical protein BECKLPF1236C_GA0070990_1013710 [Candidatus Kentron sp. LPFa]